MKSITSLYKIGCGPSSSHTMGPEQACNIIKHEFDNITHVEVTLYGSLALTGKGHLTDEVIKKTLQPISCNVNFDYTTKQTHPNTLTFDITLADNTVVKWTVLSIGGGDIEIQEFEQDAVDPNVHKYDQFKQYEDNFKNADDIIDHLLLEDSQLSNHIDEVYEAMINCVNQGLTNTGVIPGILKLKRCAKQMFETATSKELKLSSYAQAANEQNASGGVVVTAPTCGACGIIPAICYYYANDEQMDPTKIKRGLIIAGLIGDLVRHNATISGAEGGCQAEVGTATSMGAALFAYLNDESIDIIEQSAIIGLEHQLGLTCDPVLGYVQIPCINRNAMGVVKSLMAYEYAKHQPPMVLDFDDMIQVLYETGKDLKTEYRETSLGGLAKLYNERNS